MSHKNVLKLLFPLGLDGVFNDDIEIEGDHLDAVQTRVEELLQEIFPEQSYELLTSWERVCGLTPAEADTLQKRRDAVVQKLRERGELTRAYYITITDRLGYTITIEEMQPFRTGVNRAGDTIYVDEIIFVWTVNVSGYSIYYFRAGESFTGERLLSWDAQTALEDVLNDIKPAHTFIIFNYS